VRELVRAGVTREVLGVYRQGVVGSSIYLTTTTKKYVPIVSCPSGDRERRREREERRREREERTREREKGRKRGREAEKERKERENDRKRG